MWEKGLYMVYVNPPERTVLSRHHYMKGVHLVKDFPKMVLPLLTPEMRKQYKAKGIDVFQTPPLDQLKVFDHHLRVARSVDLIPGARNPWKMRLFPSERPGTHNSTSTSFMRG
jgi:hypothetical protein